MGTSASYVDTDMRWDDANTSWNDLDVEWDLTKRREFSLLVTESINISDETVKNINIIFPTEMISIADSMDRVSIFKRAFNESINIQDLISKQPIKSFIESLSVTDDKQEKSIIKGFQENISVAEDEEDPGFYDRSFNETVKISESLSKHLKKYVSENFQIKEGCLYPIPDGAFSDNCFDNVSVQSLDDNNFIVHSSPADFSPFQPFIDGNYDFKSAFIRFKIEDKSEGASLEIDITKQKITCDVEDIFFQGTVTITNTTDYTRVNFPNSFNSIPSVVVTGSNAAEFSVPEIILPDKTGFSVRLRKINDTNSKGAVSWQARGY